MWKSVFPLFLRSTKAMSLSLRRTPRWSPSSSNTFTTTGRVTACPSPPWWRESFSSWWVARIQWHGALLQTMTATVPEKHANPVDSQQECAAYLPLLLESVTSFFFNPLCHAVSVFTPVLYQLISGASCNNSTSKASIIIFVLNNKRMVASRGLALWRVKHQSCTSTVLQWINYPFKPCIPS